MSWDGSSGSRRRPRPPPGLAEVPGSRNCATAAFFPTSISTVRELHESRVEYSNLPLICQSSENIGDFFGVNRCGVTSYTLYEKRSAPPEEVTSRKSFLQPFFSFSFPLRGSRSEDLFVLVYDTRDNNPIGSDRPVGPCGMMFYIFLMSAVPCASFPPQNSIWFDEAV